MIDVNQTKQVTTFETTISIIPAVDIYGKLVISFRVPHESGFSLSTPYVLSMEESLRIAKAVIYLQGLQEVRASNESQETPK